MLHARLFAVLSCVALPLHAQADEDSRDTIRLRNGKELRGRVSRYYDADEVILVRRGKRAHVDRRHIAEISTVNDGLRELFELLEQRGNHPRFRWMMAEWARSRGLDAMGRVLALETVLADDTHQGAHEMLVHRPVRKKGEIVGWMWPLKSKDGVGSRFVNKKRFLDYSSDMGHAWAMESEHFRVVTDAGPLMAARSLLDLERMYLFWMDRFGTALQLREVLEPIEIRIWADRDKMPGLSAEKDPYMRVW